MRFAKWVYLIAGIWGILVSLPLYFMESRLNQDYPPAITHPEYFYGFLGVTLAWQVLFLILARHPLRYRTLMLPTLLEKASYGLAVAVLYGQGRASSFVLGFGLIDLFWFLLFLLAYLKTGRVAEGAADRGK